MGSEMCIRDSCHLVRLRVAHVLLLRTEQSRCQLRCHRFRILYMLPDVGTICICCLMSVLFVFVAQYRQYLIFLPAERLHRHTPSDEFYHFLGTLVFDERQPCQTDMCHMVPNCPHCPIACARSLCCWIVFRSPEQLNRTPCLSGTTNNQSLHNTTE